MSDKIDVQWVIDNFCIGCFHNREVFDVKNKIVMESKCKDNPCWRRKNFIAALLKEVEKNKEIN